MNAGQVKVGILNFSAGKCAGSEREEKKKEDHESESRDETGHGEGSVTRNHGNFGEEGEEGAGDHEQSADEHAEKTSNATDAIGTKMTRTEVSVDAPGAAEFKRAARLCALEGSIPREFEDDRIFPRDRGRKAGAEDAAFGKDRVIADDQRIGLLEKIAVNGQRNRRSVRQRNERLIRHPSFEFRHSSIL